jgi:hypothetical protein
VEQELSNLRRPPVSAERSIWAAIGIVAVGLAIIAAVVVSVSHLSVHP